MTTVGALRDAIKDVDDDVEVRIVVHTPDGSTNVKVDYTNGGFTTGFNLVADVRRPGVRFRWGQPVAKTPPVVEQSPLAGSSPPVEIKSNDEETK